jgi:hypothetical protein
MGERKKGYRSKKKVEKEKGWKKDYKERMKEMK